MLAKDSVSSRLEAGGISYTEFSYQVLQALDYLELFRKYKCRLQLGGSDQWGNIVTGIDLGRRMGRPQLYALTSPLLTTSSGAKMGKTAAGAVWLNEDMLPIYDYWQFWRNTEDADVGRFLRLFTELPMDEIRKLYPGAQFIHIVRDGRDQAIDISDSLLWPYSVYSGAHLWQRYVLAVRDCAREMPADAFLEIR